MDEITAKPYLLKQANLSLIRKVIKRKGTATRAEIAQETGISSTTVRALLYEMIQNREIESIGYDESSGGRKAERYGFMPDRYYGAVFCISGSQLHAHLINICGEIVDSSVLEVHGEDYEKPILPYLDELTAKKEIKAIGLGVPGIVEGGCYWRKRTDSGDLYRVDIGGTLSKRYDVPIVLENDLKAAAIGFGRCYQKEFPEVKIENVNMAYLYFEKGCISAGFIVEGRIARGYRNFAGELGLIPIGREKLLDELMSEPMEDREYVEYVAQILGWICGILNPEYIALGGPDLRKDCVSAIGNYLTGQLVHQMTAEILYSDNFWKDYGSGMAYLTAGKIFDEIQFIKQ